MPDSLLPPSWGPVPFDERDLDAVLSGETADIPDVLRPVAETLTALRAAPAAAELRGEPAAMAEFRALGLGRAGRADTLEFPALLAGGSPRRAARHRARRRPGRAVSRRAGVLMSAAAVVLIAVIVAFSGNLPAPIERLARFVHPAATSSSAVHHAGHGCTSAKHRGTGPATPVAPSVTSRATPSVRPVTPGPSPSSSAARGRLCQDAYRSLLQPPRSRSSWAADISLWQQLTKMAGGPTHVFRYCSPYLKAPFPGGFPHGAPGVGSPSSAKVPANTGQGNQSPRNASARPGQGATGSPTASAGPVQGNQGGGPAPTPTP